MARYGDHRCDGRFAVVAVPVSRVMDAVLGSVGFLLDLVWRVRAGDLELLPWSSHCRDAAVAHRVGGNRHGPDLGSASDAL